MAVGGSGGTGGSGGMKFTLSLNTVANSSGVQQLASQLKNLQTKLAGFQTAMKNSQTDFNKSLLGAQAQGYYVAATLERAGQKSLWFSKVFASATVGSFTTLMHEAANLEQFIIRLQSTQGTTKKDALDIFNTTLRATAHLPITESQLVRVATTFKQRGIDIRDAFGGKTYQNIIDSGHAVEGLADTMKGLGKQSVTVLDLFGDLATTQGQLGTEDIGKFVREFSEFMATGQTRFLRTRLDPALLHELNLTKGNSAKAMETIYEYLAKRNAVGVSRLAMQTFSGVMTNFQGLPQRIANAVFQPGITDGLARRFSMALSNAFERISQYFDETTEKGKKFLPELRKIFEFIGTVAIAAVNGLTRAFEGFANFLANNPSFGVFLTMVTGIVSGLLALKGALYLVRGSLLVMALAAKAVATISTVMNVGLGVMAAKYSLLIAVGGLFFAVFRKVAMVIGAVFEAMQSYDPEKGIAGISRKTYDELQKSGLVTLFEKMLGFVVKVKNVFEDKLSMAEAWPWFGKIQRAIDQITTAFTQFIALVFGVDDGVSRTDQTVNGFSNTTETTSMNIGKAAEAAGNLAKVLKEDVAAGVSLALKGFAIMIGVIDVLIRAVLRLGMLLAGMGALFLAFTGNVVGALGMVAGFAGLAYLDSKYTEGIDRDPNSALGLPSIVGKAWARADKIDAGLLDAENFGDNQSRPKSEDLKYVDTVVDPVTGKQFRVPTHGSLTDSQGQGYASWYNPNTFYQTQNPMALGGTKVNVTNNVSIDSKAVANAISTQIKKEQDRAGSNGIRPPMSTPMGGYEDESAQASIAY